LASARASSNATEIVLPQGLANVVAGVGGLSASVEAAGGRETSEPQFTSHFSGNHFLAPADWATNL